MTAVQLKAIKDVARQALRDEFRKYPGDDIQSLRDFAEKLIIRTVGAVAHGYESEALERAAQKHDTHKRIFANRA